MVAHGTLLTGHFPDPQTSPLWPGIEAMLQPAAEYGGCQVFGEGHELWVAVVGGLIVGAVTARGLADGNAEIMNVGGVNARLWWSEVTSQIEEWARQNGAAKICSQGRRGWWRWIQEFGWQRVRDDGRRAWYEKDLSQ